MTQIGEIKRGSELGKAYYNKFIWHACVDCGRERWEEILGGQPRYLRCRRCGDKLRGNQGANNPRWKGGRFKQRQGYILIRLYPDDLYYSMANSHHYVFEHRLIMAEHLGRSLEQYEKVHHKNGIKDDNRYPENLELWLKKQPSGQRIEDILEYAYWVIDKYEMLW